MIETVIRGVRVRLSPFFFGVITLFLLADTQGLAVPALWAVFCHELGHLLMLCLLREKPRALTLGAYGICLERGGPLSYRREAAVCLAGPLANFLCAGVLAVWGAGAAAAVHLALGVFQAAPVGRLDGGNLLRVFAEAQFPHAARRICRTVDAAFLLPLLLGGVWLLWRQRNPSLLFTAGYLLLAVLAEDT